MTRTTSYVLITSRSFGSGSSEPIQLLTDAGLGILRGDAKHSHTALAGPLSTAVAWIAGASQVDRAHLEAAPYLRIVARYGVGVDAVDLAAATMRGVVVTNTPGANADAVADHTIGLMLALLRYIIDGNTAVRGGVWPVLRGREMGALTIGLVGFGHVGRAVARRLVGGFGSRVLAFDPHIEVEEFQKVGAYCVNDLDALVSSVDLLSLHLPSIGRPLVTANLLARMRPGSILINTARGDLLDEAAVASMLKTGHLAAAAFDVLITEMGTTSPLLDAPNVIITPHIAAQTVESVDRMGVMAAQEVIRVLEGKPARHPVNVKYHGADRSGQSAE